MKKLLCLFLLVVMVLPLSSCGAKNYQEYEVVYSGGLANEQFFLDIDPFDLEAGESCFATLTRYVYGEISYQSPVMVFVNTDPQYNYDYCFRTLPLNSYQHVYDSTLGVWKELYTQK